MIPLEQLGVNARSMKPALAWLWLLYRRPTEFQLAFEQLDRSYSARAGLSLSLYLIPVLFVLTHCLRLILDVSQSHAVSWKAHSQATASFELGILAGLNRTLVGFAGSLGGPSRGIAVGIAMGSISSVLFGCFLGSTTIDNFVVACCVCAGFISGIANGSRVTHFRIYQTANLVLLLTLGLNLAVGGLAPGTIIVAPLAYYITRTRAFYWPLSMAFVLPNLRVEWYRFHPAAWDSMCYLPFPYLDQLLLAIAEKHPVAGDTEIDRLVDAYPAQRNAALRAKSTRVARSLQQVQRLADLPSNTSRLPAGDKGYLKQTERIHQAALEIADLQTRLDTLDRPILRQPTAESLLKTIQSFGHQLAGFEEPLKTEFRAAAKHWEQLAQVQLDEINNALAREPIQQFFRAGDPVDRNREAFIARDRVTGELEQQIMLATGCPGVILYGRRRVGKSTVLRDLPYSLPKQKVRVAYLSAQNPDLFASTESFAQAIATATNPTASATTLSELYNILTKENETLTQSNQRLVLAIDEYEMLDRKIGEGVFTTDLLDTLRESIQSHRNITWILAGSHQITELPNAPWTSYLVSARLVEVPVFSAAETRLLLTTPARYSTLWAKDDPNRPHFDPSFWGEGGLDRIHQETGGWPHLVQLVAETCVDLVNDESAQNVTPALLEKAFNKAIVRGEAVFHELLRRESIHPGEWEYLEAFRRHKAQPEPADPTIARSLRRRELIDIEGATWKLRVPLMRRWLIERS